MSPKIPFLTNITTHQIELNPFLRGPQISTTSKINSPTKTTTRQIHDYFPTIYPGRTQVNNISNDISECLLACPGFLPKSAPKHIELSSHEISYHSPEAVLSSTISAPLPQFLHFNLNYSSLQPPVFLVLELPFISQPQRESRPPLFPAGSGSPLLFSNTEQGN